MERIAAAVLQDCLAQDFGSARSRLRELAPAELRELQTAAMALQNLVAARRYALAQRHLAVVQQLQAAKTAK